ncbi:hypothetical protein [Streptomyces iconiensis]|uniref:Uncharacterized protein n=1 Tax=Streptomyces iconiensis TaxID=1384038 RepID=A0ABT7A460_9ACTN|nr:hypothetical protein [Streptomyces iconiensis]MDJ1136086.1 hypothetical protein [Streptomyces iconiensis]
MLAAGGLYCALTIAPRDELDEHTLTGIEVACFLTVACSTAALLLACLLRKTLSPWWTAPALCFLLAGTARWAHVVHTYPPP